MALPSRRAAAVAAACALYAVQPCDAAGGKSIFKLTDQVDTKAWSVMWMYFVVFVVTIGFEVLVHWLHHTVSSDSGQAVVHHVTQEVMILGGISAVLVVFENSGGGELIDAALFHYVHFVIFLMMILFIFLVSSLFLLVNRSWSRWSQFENGLEDIVGDPSLSEQQRSAFLQQYVRHFPKGRKMIAAYTFFRQNLPERLQQCSLTRYMKKMERKFLLSFVHLHPKSWVLLGGLCAAVAVVTEVTIMISDNELAIISLWILFVGLGPAIVMGVVYYKVRKEFDLFVIGVQEIRAWSLLKPQKSQKHHFWMQKPGFTVTVIQTMLHFQVFFLANAVTNFCYRLSGMMPLGPPIIVMMFVLPLFVFLVMLPITLPPFTILASLGEYIDHKTLLKMVETDKNSGAARRLWLRDGLILRPAQFRVESRRRYDLITRQRDGPKVGPDRYTLPPQKSADGLPPLLLNDVGEEVMRADVREACRECRQAEAQSYCGTCQLLLCVECDTDYHRLRLLRDHPRWPVGDSALEKKRRVGLESRGR